MSLPVRALGENGRTVRPLCHFLTLVTEHLWGDAGQALEGLAEMEEVAVPQGHGDLFD